MDTDTRAIIDTWKYLRDSSRHANTTDAVTFCQATLELGEWLRAYEPGNTFTYVAENLKLLKSLPHELRLSVALTSHRQLGQCAFLLGKSNLSHFYLERTNSFLARIRTLKDPIQLAHIYHLQGGVASEQRDSTGAMPALKAALTYCTESGNRRKQVSILHTLSSYYGRTNRPKEALDVIEEAIELDRSTIAHPYIRLLLQINLAWAYHDLDEINTALDTISRTMKMAHSMNHSLGLGICHASIGHFLNRKRIYDEARLHFEDALSLIEHVGYRRNRSKLLQGLAVAQAGIGPGGKYL